MLPISDSWVITLGFSPGLWDEDLSLQLPDSKEAPVKYGTQNGLWRVPQPHLTEVIECWNMNGWDLDEWVFDFWTVWGIRVECETILVHHNTTSDWLMKEDVTDHVFSKKKDEKRGISGQRLQVGMASPRWQSWHFSGSFCESCSEKGTLSRGHEIHLKHSSLRVAPTRNIWKISNIDLNKETRSANMPDFQIPLPTAPCSSTEVSSSKFDSFGGIAHLETWSLKFQKSHLWHGQVCSYLLNGWTFNIFLGHGNLTKSELFLWGQPSR